jgi:hypothetical protein
MPINARWRKLEGLPAARGRDAMPGIYEIADANKQLIYIGQSASDVPNRIRQHLERLTCISQQAHYWRYSYSRIPQADEAKQLELYRQRYGELPACNQAKPLERDSQRRYSERSRSD